MNRIELNKIKLNTLAPNRIGGGVVSVSASGGGTEEVPDGYQMLMDIEDAYLIDSNDKIIVVPVEDEEVNLPSFTITKNGEDKVYYFEEGMNFADWINSEYNTDGYETLSAFMWEYISNDGGYTALYDRALLLHPYDNYPEDGWVYTAELFGNGGNADTPSGNNIIKFTFLGEEYTAEEGMTWYEWCQSSYNVDGWTCDSQNDLVYTWKDYLDPWNYEYFFVVYDGTSVLGSDAIIPNGNYEEYEDSMHIGGGE